MSVENSRELARMACKSLLFPLQGNDEVAKSSEGNG
jgi:hypothetical protein